MLGIGEFFKRIQNVHAQEVFARSEVRDVIRTVVGIELTIEQITFSGTSIKLKNVSQGLRSAIYIKKPPLLAELAARLPERKITDIS